MLATKIISATRGSYYNIISKTIQYKKIRWLFTILLILFYCQRTYGMSYSVITYLLGFYFLQLIVNYFTPKGIELQENILIEQQQQQFFQEITDKPLVSSMSQFQIWERISFAFSLGLLCTCFKLIQIDVFWPLLMIYFIVLVCYTIHKIITKMEKYRYTMSDFLKKVPVM